MTSADTSSQAVQPGDVLAEKYRVERVLGQGGMGVVVLAEHLELRERVAIKFLLEAAGDGGELAERFLREARAAVKIKSEHVVRVIDVGRLPTGAPYMVMEYLEGEDLSQRLLSGPVPIEDAVDYLIQACEAMHVAHRAGIVHRDLKPANLFLTQRPDGSSLIKVLDFGISKVKSTDASQLSLTHTQAMMGSPLYMSPEQMRSSKDVSPSADIWSLGVILHELIAGDVPFTGSTFPEVLVQVMSEQPPRLRSLRPEVPESLEAVVLRCLEKDPAERYSSVAALGVALAPYGSPRTLGLQQRLRGNLSRPPPPAPLPPAPPKLLEVTHVHGPAPGAAAPIAPAPHTLPSFVGGPREQLPSKTNTAWGEQSISGASHAAGARRRWLIAGGSLVALALLGLGLARVGSAPAPGAALPAASAAPPAAAVPAVSSAPSVRPAAPPPTLSEPALSEPRIIPAPPATTPTVERATEAPASAALAAGAAERASGEHTLAAAPTTEQEAKSAPLPAPRSAPRRARASSERTVRARSTASVSKPAPTAPTPSAPAPAPAAAPAPTKSKPLSIEFK